MLILGQRLILYILLLFFMKNQKTVLITGASSGMGRAQMVSFSMILH
jgi:NADPH:quinone reductase-like Zn-dependent oxidoreductase